MSKYTAENLVPAFREAAAFRNRMLEYGFTDNGGAIHSAERILNILGQRIRYPGLGHINNLRNYNDAEFSQKAQEAHARGKTVLIEHVAPLRDFTRKAIALFDGGATDEQFLEFIRQNYRLVLLTPEEAKRLNKINRTKMTPDRLGEAGIQMA